MQLEAPGKRRESSARLWAPLTRFILVERRAGAWADRGPVRRVLYEVLRFAMKQAWACLFAGVLLAAIVATRFYYPSWMPLTRYDMLFVLAILTQVALLALRFERPYEARVILVFHVVATVMELFKTAKGSWVYPEPNLIRIMGVPLFSGFLYSAVGSYMARVWRLFDFRFSHYPDPRWTWVLAALIYVNFFTHHYIVDLRLGLFAFAAMIWGRTWIHFTIDAVPRRMPLLIGFFLVSLFIWIAENVGSFSAVWLYPHQMKAWSPVSLGKLGAWFLLMLISFVLVTIVHTPRGLDRAPAGGRSPDAG